jgi:hypothetical protein
MDDNQKITAPKMADTDRSIEKQMPPAAQRALQEAAERKAASAKIKEAQKPEINGRGGLDPARYGDWEKKGIAVDF